MIEQLAVEGLAYPNCNLCETLTISLAFGAAYMSSSSRGDPLPLAEPGADQE
jgi:hypothetical protein